jgi:t-SNARE complex subunit (syntaxin)
MSKAYLEKLRIELEEKLKLGKEKIVISPSSPKKIIDFYSKLNRTLGKALYTKLLTKLSEEELEEVEESIDEYLEVCTDFHNINFYYLNSLVGILETLLGIEINIEFKGDEEE